MAGNPRVYKYANGGIIDMGAFENQTIYTGPDANNILYVNKTVSGGNGSGDSWTNAAPELADALKYARQKNNYTTENPLKIYVAKGTYKPLYNADNGGYMTDGGRDNAFVLVNNVLVYGGFDPDNGIDDLSDTRIFGSGGSILSGDIGTPDDNTDNCYHVVISVGTNSNGVISGTARLDGFTVSGGYAQGTSGYIQVNGYDYVSRTLGAGMYNYGFSPTVASCTFTGNSGIGLGGGMYDGGSSGNMTTITNTHFDGNSARLGGGLYIDSPSPSITNCSFTGNTAIHFNGGSGGGMYLTYTGSDVSSSPTITNCSFTGNTALYYGGGILLDGLYSYTTPIITNCSIIGNTLTGVLASNNGSGIEIRRSNPTITNTTIANNGSVGLFIDNSALPVFQNTIIWDAINGVSYTSTYSLLKGENPSGTGNVDATTLTADDVFNDYANGDYTLKNSSPAVNAGSNALFVGLDANTKDLAGNPRVYDYAGEGIIDLGAYEYQGAPLPIQLLTFTAQKQNTTALLKWTTATEQNNHGFEIQRSTDGKHWTSLTFVPSQANGGNSLSALQYSYSDDTPTKSVNYYRLKQIDRNGSYEYSIIRSVSFDGGRAINVYPNPATVQVTVTGLQKEDHITLVDGLGNKVRQYESDGEEMTVMMDQLQRGIYYIVVINGDTAVATFKVVKGE